MRKLLFGIFILATLMASSQEERTFLMTSQKNEVCTFSDKKKWIVHNRTYANIEFEVRNGIIYSTDENESRYTPISKKEIEEKDNYSTFGFYCKDNKDRSCRVTLYKLNSETSLFMITIEYSFAKLFYYRENE